jgi:hypothetical protein
MATDLHRLTIAEAASLIRRRELSPVDLTRAFVERIDALNPTLNAYVRPTPERALADARAAEAEIAAGRAPRERLTGYYQLQERGWRVAISDGRWMGPFANVRRRMQRFGHWPRQTLCLARARLQTPASWQTATARLGNSHNSQKLLDFAFPPD